MFQIIYLFTKLYIQKEVCFLKKKIKIKLSKDYHSFFHINRLSQRLHDNPPEADFSIDVQHEVKISLQIRTMHRNKR